MKDRIRKIQDREGMTQKDFAAAIGISQASLSSIYNGRTQPTSRHVEAIHKRFPEIRLNWIMFGEGEMIGAGEGVRPSNSPQTLFDQETTTSPESQQPEAQNPGSPMIREIVKYIDKPQRRIREIQVIYDDGMLETFVLKSDK